MVRRSEVFTALFGDEALQVGLNRSLVLAVRDKLVVYLAEDALQGFGVVHQHVAGRGAHENFDARHVALGNLLEFLQILVGGAHIEAVVGPGNLGGACVFLLQFLNRGGLGNGVGLFHVAGHPTGNGCHRLGSDVPFVGEAGLPKMDLGIDDSG